MILGLKLGLKFGGWHNLKEYGDILIQLEVDSLCSQMKMLNGETYTYKVRAIKNDTIFEFRLHKSNNNIIC